MIWILIYKKWLLHLFWVVVVKRLIVSLILSVSGRAWGAAEVCVHRVFGSLIREWKGTGDIQRHSAVCPKGSAALLIASCSKPWNNWWRSLWNNSHRWEKKNVQWHIYSFFFNYYYFLPLSFHKLWAGGSGGRISWIYQGVSVQLCFYA